MRDAVDAAAEEAGARVVAKGDDRPASTYDHDRLLHSRAPMYGEKWARAVARIARILEGADASATSIEEKCRTAAVPALAREYMTLVTYYQLFRHRRDRWNPFLDLSDKDAGRKFMAAIYSLCDRSTGRLGGWWP